MNTIETLLNLVDKKINSQSTDTSSKILELIEYTFIELDTPKFSTLLSNKVIKPIANKIEELEHLKNSLGGSRTNFKLRRSIFTKINYLKDLLKEVFTLYHLYLNRDKFFQLYEKEEKEKFFNYEDKIIKGSLDEDILQSAMYPTYFDVEKIQKLTNVIKEQIKSLNLDKDNYNYAKDRTTSFYNRTKDSITSISIAIDKTNTTLKDAETKLKKVNENEIYEDDENSITYNLYDYYHQNVIDLYYNLDNLIKHKTLLIDILKNLNKNYTYLKDSEGFTRAKITVFGDSNFEVVNQLALELKDKGFVSNQTTINDLLEVFTKSEEEPINKINLTNGTLNDFGYLMSKMRESFVVSIKDKANYSKWWSDRFTFNSKEKTIKDVSNMISAVNKDLSRRPTKIATILKIVESIKTIPH